MTKVLERDLDKKFYLMCFYEGWESLKLSTLGRFGANGWPDRLVVLPNGKVCFVEMKRPGGKTTPKQDQKIKALRDLGHLVLVTSDPKSAILTIKHNLCKQ